MELESKAKNMLLCKPWGAARDPAGMVTDVGSETCSLGM